MTSLRHQLHVYSPGICMCLLRILTLSLDDGNRPVISQTRYSRVNVQKPDPEAGTEEAEGCCPWRWPGSNRRPPACKAGALPAELHPRSDTSVGLCGFEPQTSRLSAVRSHQLS